MSGASRDFRSTPMTVFPGIRDAPLHLDDGDSPRRRMTAEHVDRATLSVDRERNFHVSVPLRITQNPDDLVDERGVTLIDEPLEGFAPPAKVQREHPVE